VLVNDVEEMQNKGDYSSENPGDGIPLKAENFFNFIFRISLC
jgi:hypothetical protein